MSVFLKLILQINDSNMTTKKEIIAYAVSMILKAERVIETLKYEWLKKIPIIRGYQHLVQLCIDFSERYNNWRPHEFLGSITPGVVYGKKAVPLVPKSAKKAPVNMETKRFRETKITGYRIAEAA